MLTEKLPQLLEDVPLTTQHTVYFVYDWGPVCFTCNLRQFLDCQYTDWWIWLALWPLQLSSPIHANFYIWGHLKGIVDLTRFSMWGWTLVFDVSGCSFSTTHVWNFWYHRTCLSMWIKKSIFNNCFKQFISIRMLLCWCDV